MDLLPYRATIFLRPAGLSCGQLELMERSFAKENDAVFWCRVMCEADPQATGVWMVARSKGGRMLELTSEQGLASAVGQAAMNQLMTTGPGAAELGSVLAGTTIRPKSPLVGMDPMGVELVAGA
jgi:hypothetical protein